MLLVLKHTVFISEYKILEFALLFTFWRYAKFAYIACSCWQCSDIVAKKETLVVWKFITVNDVFHLRKWGARHHLEGLTLLAQKTIELTTNNEPSPSHYVGAWNREEMKLQVLWRSVASVEYHKIIVTFKRTPLRHCFLRHVNYVLRPFVLMTSSVHQTQCWKRPE